MKFEEKSDEKSTLQESVKLRVSDPPEGICPPERYVENAFWRINSGDALHRVVQSMLNAENHASHSCTVWWQCEKCSNKPNSTTTSKCQPPQYEWIKSETNSEQNKHFCRERQRLINALPGVPSSEDGMSDFRPSSSFDLCASAFPCDMISK